MTNPNKTKLEKFGTDLYATLYSQPFGSVSKTELELAYFSALVDSEIVKLDGLNDFELARMLRCTPTKASNLRFNYYIRYTQSRNIEQLRSDLARHVVVAEISEQVTKTEASKSKDSEITFTVEHKFWRSFFVTELNRAGIPFDTSFNRERVVVKTKAFAKNAHEVFGIHPSAVEKIYNDEDVKLSDNERVARLRKSFDKVLEGGLIEAGSQTFVTVLKLGQKILELPF